MTKLIVNVQKRCPSPVFGSRRMRGADRTDANSYCMQTSKSMAICVAVGTGSYSRLVKVYEVVDFKRSLPSFGTKEYAPFLLAPK